MKLYFHNFWNGFIEGTDPINVSFFITLFNNVFKAQTNIGSEEDSDVLIESMFGERSLALSKKWRYTFLFSGESYFKTSVPLNSYTCILGCKETNGNYVCLPLYIIYMLCNNYTYTPCTTIPHNIVCAVISHKDGIVRNKFLDSLEKHTNVVYGGGFRNNIGNTLQGSYNSDNLINFYKQFRFVITMENSEESQYITEKIINGFRAGVIPVYWGSPNAIQHFNKDRFLQLKDDSEEEITSLIYKMMSMSSDEYLWRVNQPIFIKNNDISEIVNDVRRCICN